MDIGKLQVDKRINTKPHSYATGESKNTPKGLWDQKNPATFQKALGLILTAFKWKTFLIYVDDVII